MLIKNGEDAKNHTARIIEGHYFGEISEAHARTQLFGLAVYSRLLKYTSDVSRLDDASIKRIEISSEDKDIDL